MLVGNAQLVAGGAEKIGVLLDLLAAEGIEVRQNRDIYSRIYAHFGAEEARALRSRSQLRGIHGRRVFIIVASVMTVEAQNILLKTIEEPAGDALFFFVTPSPSTLLATVRSRSQMLSLEDAQGAGIVDAKRFIASDAARRMEMLKPLLEKGEEDKRDMGAIITLLSSLERILSGVKDAQAKRKGLESIYVARKYVTDKGALVKTLLEQVALIVPKV